MRTDLPVGGHVAPTDGARSRGQSLGIGSLDQAPADAFRKHLSLAAADDARVRRPDKAGDREPPKVRWQNRSAPMPQDEPPAAVTEKRAVGEDASEPPSADAALSGPRHPCTDAGLAGAAATQPLPAASVGANSIQSALLAAPAGMAEPPCSGSTASNGQLHVSVPASGREVSGTVADVLVVSRETHLAPASLALYPDASAAQGKDSGQRPAHGSLGSSPTLDAGLRAQDPAADEASFGLSTAHRSAGPAGDAAAPVLPPASLPMRQIADRIAANIAGSEPGRTDPASSLPAPSTGHPLKVLTIQLHPVELGAVTVRIALKNDALELRIDAGRRETARLLDADRETLSGLLRSAGYSVDALTVRAVEPPNAAAAAGSAPGSSNSAPQSQSGGSHADARPSGGGAHADRDNTHGTPRDSNDGQGGLRHNAGDSLYV